MRKLIIPTTLLVIIASSTAFAGGLTSWSYSSTHNYGSYVPNAGTFTEGIYGSQYWSRVNFVFESSDITSIKDYMNGGDNPGTNCDNVKAYVTVDMTAVGDSWDDEIDGATIYTTLPSAYKDFDDDNWDGEKEESEVVALSAPLSGTSYYMRTYWNDYRDGDAGDSGKIQVQFGMSRPAGSEYNTCVNSGDVQIINPYGDNYGSL
ncbi:MAG: hypothetical protein KC431_21355 [Myxococcales bacterium]|nr:hypothetical protein [Myxococcales bacterium]